MRISSAIRTSKRQAESAFTLIEAMVGFAVAAIAMVSLYAGITYGMAITQVTRENLRATQLILEKFETVRLYRWDQLNGTNGFVVPTYFTNSYAVDTAGVASGVVYTGTMSIASAPVGVTYSNDMKLVTVTLTWISAGVKRTRTMETLVARQGLQQYVY